MGLDRLNKLLDNVLTWRSCPSVGTACSGSDLVMVFLRWLTSHWQRSYGVHENASFLQKFACEKVDFKK
eukprot:10686988-Alexandrium_andersonii.AAC.1